MAKAPEPAVTADDIFFELERFEPSDGRLTLSGRWFGVRGRRFVRPTLTLAVAGERMRALADLDGKPWAAEDGEPWQASFPWEKTGRVEEPELSVAPDITILLPAPGARNPRARRLAAEPRRDTMTASWASLVATIEASPPGEADLAVEPGAAAPLLEAPAPDPQVLHAELEALRGELSEATDAGTAAESAIEELQRELASVRAQLEEAQHRLAAQANELAAAQTELAAVRTAREAALRSGAQAEADRDDALARAAEAEAERDALSAETAALGAALEERRATVEQLTRRHQEVVATRGAALVMRGATQALPAHAPSSGWVRRGAVVLGLLVIVLLVLILLHAL
jgi:hypothetical protein